MESTEILKKINHIFATVLENREILLSRETIITTIKGWDSFSNIRLIMSMEKNFELKFNTFEIQSCKNIGDLCDTIQRKQT
jgi:acyl carrier protein